MIPRVHAFCWFRDEDEAEMRARVEHLLGKTYTNLHWSFYAGDTEKPTRQILTAIVGDRAVVREHNTRIPGNDPPARIRRLSAMLAAAMSYVGPDDDWCLLHESDLVSPADIVERLLAVGGDVVGGWPVLDIPGVGVSFYDTLAYYKDHVHFTNGPPYHTCYRADEPFQVDGVGSVVLFPAADAPHVKPVDHAIMEVVRKLRQRGRSVWCDPRVVIEQPRHRWSSTRPIFFRT